MQLQQQQLKPQTQPQQHHYQQQQQQQPPPQAKDISTTPTSSNPPLFEEVLLKQVAKAMDRLSHAARLIADIRLGPDRHLEALFIAAQPHQSNKPLHLFLKEDSSMCQHLHDLHSVVRVSSFLKLCFLIQVGRQLEESRVLSESLRSQSNSWGFD